MKTNSQDKTVAIVAYLTLIGFIIALILNANRTGDNKRFNAFHLRQSLGVFIIIIILNICAGIITSILPIFSFISTIIWIASLIMLVFGLIGAVNGEEKLIPIVGEPIQKAFGNTFG